MHLQDSGKQFSLEVSYEITFRCWLGCRYLKAQLGWMSRGLTHMADSWYQLWAGSSPGNVDWSTYVVLLQLLHVAPAAHSIAFGLREGAAQEQHFKKAGSQSHQKLRAVTSKFHHMREQVSTHEFWEGTSRQCLASALKYRNWAAGLVFVPCFLVQGPKNRQW